jgi:hypothetical protein
MSAGSGIAPNAATLALVDEMRKTSCCKQINNDSSNASVKRVLCSISWCPDKGTPAKVKMTFASTKTAFETKINVGKKFQANDISDISDMKIDEITISVSGNLVAYLENADGPRFAVADIWIYKNPDGAQYGEIGCFAGFKVQGTEVIPDDYTIKSGNDAKYQTKNLAV